jgi:hypothetical protein
MAELVEHHGSEDREDEQRAARYRCDALAGDQVTEG